MTQPSTVVVLKDADGDEFPVSLPGVFRSNRGADVAAADQIAAEYVRDGIWRPSGDLVVHHIEYHNEVAS